MIPKYFRDFQYMRHPAGRIVAIRPYQDFVKSLSNLFKIILAKILLLIKRITQGNFCAHLVLKCARQFLCSSRAQMRYDRAHVALSLRSRRIQTP